MPKNTDYYNRRYLAFIHDLLMIPIAWLGAYWLRYNLGFMPEAIFMRAIDLLPLVITIQTVSYWMYGLYRGVWRFASLPDLERIIKSVLTSVFIIATLLFLHNRLHGIPRSVLPLYAILLVGLLGGARFIFRRFKQVTRFYARGTRVLIVGAGQAGEGIVRDLLRDVSNEYNPVAFVDDRRRKIGQEIHGIRVVGNCSQIPQVVKRFNIELIIIAVPSASSAQMRCIVDACECTATPFYTLPGLYDLTSGHISIDTLRQVSLEDLLGRDQVSLDWQRINANLSDKTVLLTGGGGSIGAELCRQLARLRPRDIIIVDNCEFNLYCIERSMQKHFPDSVYQIYLANITDRSAMRDIFAKTRPDIVFHAAAYKHVPLLESHLRVALLNNVVGTRIVAEQAVAQNVKKFVMISTDKAVNPTSLMGATKRAAEVFCQNYNGRTLTEFITVRFGNVIDSTGSVVPLFREQIRQGGPVTVTHPDVTRYFMSIPEACQLIMQATVMGAGGEIYSLDMGEPIKIRYLAEQMIRLSGKKVGEGIDIVYCGLRPGEKLYEELFHEHEILTKTEHQKILQAAPRSIGWERLMQVLDTMAAACETHNEQQLATCLQMLVPEYAQSVVKKKVLVTELSN